MTNGVAGNSGGGRPARRSRAEVPAEALESGYDEAIRDPLWGNVHLTPELAALVSSPPFQKLTRIRQLGPAALVYPGATHTRAAHSLGVYHLARRMLRLLLERGADAWVDAVGARSFLAAALLHDLGHFPYAHSLKELPLEEHEALTARYVLEEPLASLLGRAGADKELVSSIVDKGRPQADGVQTPFFRALLSGPLDPDKLDYLRRDAWACGVPYGAQDVDFVLSRLRPHRVRGTDIDAKGIPSVEDLLFSKYLMYRSVYWHRDVRVATAMMKKAVVAGLDDGVIAPEELYGLDDDGLFSLLAARPCPAFALAKELREGRLFRVVAEGSFDRSLALHEAAASIEGRAALEAGLAEELSAASGATLGPLDVVVDVPEPVSFETSLYVLDEGRPFAESSTVFVPEVVASFGKALRVIRICVRAGRQAGGSAVERLADAAGAALERR